MQELSHLICMHGCITHVAPKRDAWAVQSFGFKYQREHLPANAETSIDRCVALIREHSGSGPIHVMSDAAVLLSGLRTACIPGVTSADGVPTHCRAAALDSAPAESSLHGALDGTIRDALVLMNARLVVGYSCYHHGSLFVRQMVDIGGRTSTHRPLFPQTRHRCAGMSVGARRCKNKSPPFIILSSDKSWLCHLHADKECAPPSNPPRPLPSALPPPSPILPAEQHERRLRPRH